MATDIIDPSSARSPAAALPTPPLAQPVMQALLEAQRMCEAIRELARTAADGETDIDLYPLMQAIRACTLTVDLAVDPIIEQELSHATCEEQS